MSEKVTMPELGESVTEGTVTRWLKAVGDEVAVDEPLLEVSTDKVDTEIPSPVAGVLQEILAEEDDTVEVGGDLAVIGDGEASGGSDDSSDEKDEEPAEEKAEEPKKAEEKTEEKAEKPAKKSSGGGEGQTVTMPELGESVTEGTVTRWLKAEGDEVEVDEPLLEVSTDKVDTEIPSPYAGVLSKIIAGEDETVEVGGELGVIGGEAGGDDSSEDEADQDADAEPMDAGSAEEVAAEGETEDPQAAAKADEKKAADKKDQEPAPAKEAPKKAESSDKGSDSETYVTPLVRKLAKQHGVDLSTLEGSGVGGRIRKQDVLAAAEGKGAEAPAKGKGAEAPAKGKGAEAPAEAPAEQPKAEQEPAEQPAQKPAAQSSGSAQKSSGALGDLQAKRGTTEKMTRLRKVIAQRMLESLQVSAQLTTVVEVDVTKIARLRDREKKAFQAREGVKLSFLPFFAQAAIEALKEHPTVNASVEDDQIVYHAQENLGMAVDTDKGLLVPVIKDAGSLNIAGIARKIDDLASRTRDNKVGPDELSGATFTLTNTGSRGALFDTPIINQPNVAILGTGAVVKRPVVVSDEDGLETIAIRSMVYLALSYDHRIVDGADAARFLGTMKERLEAGQFEV
ncbi:2-oxoglutarate dehydrogenase, E2 component, dihydrolipoamide succinyltransferase [Kytococcus schroeteri]|uniref:Dihydrolipoamide acetyltransferase component of pyruvate dehydrogenase complex n=1 Tax=Kytococcus schroeteri TaxID=138300 RepID=A0A2I1PAL4_9MICO|nr:2-oxo acid dehydrogenase subunit E2 [Kytococcus schroeteri]PKZ41660.1 2-oxoglutarate dehydrogenase, E2 component, dihydrolipoamide succinyltransferase [Kytococcus schroeteri]